MEAVSFAWFSNYVACFRNPEPRRNGLDELLYFFYSVEEMTGLGEFEQVVLLAILRLPENAYGVTISAEIQQHTGRTASPGALYTTLDRLEEKGFVRSRVGEPSPRRGGRAKRFFEVTPSGTAAVTRAQQAYQNLLQGLPLLGFNHA